MIGTVGEIRLLLNRREHCYNAKLCWLFDIRPVYNQIRGLSFEAAAEYEASLVPRWCQMMPVFVNRGAKIFRDIRSSKNVCPRPTAILNSIPHLWLLMWEMQLAASYAD